jgi:hypothetical protein
MKMAFGPLGINDCISEGRFTLRSLVKRTKDSNNLIGVEQKFIHWAFTLKANSVQNVYMTTFFVSFGAKSLFDGRKFIQDKNGNPNSS